MYIDCYYGVQEPPLPTAAEHGETHEVIGSPVGSFDLIQHPVGGGGERVETGVEIYV